MTDQSRLPSDLIKMSWELINISVLRSVSPHREKTEHERPWQWTFSWGFLAQQEPDTRPTFPPWLICQIYPADGGDNIIIWRLFCIHLFEPAGRLIFFCVDYTFMTQFSAITGLRLPLSDFLSQPGSSLIWKSSPCTITLALISPPPPRSQTWALYDENQYPC